jgi:predicted nucleic acid-binding protein
MARYLLDTSAVLAHYFDEAGADFVARLWGPGLQRPVISAVTVAELKGRLHAELGDESEAAEAARIYLDELTECLPVDRAIAELAWQIRTATPERLPLVDALIAASARSAGAILVHRDPHLAAIPRGLVEQVTLADS